MTERTWSRSCCRWGSRSLTATVLAALLFLFPAPARSQVGPCDSLPQAQRSYESSRYQEAIELVQECLDVSGRSQEETVQAYRLLALSHLGLTRRDEARAAVETLLRLVPSYRADLDEDPPEYVLLVDQVVKELYALHGGPPTGATARGAEQSAFVQVEIYYGTDRRPTGSHTAADYYGGERGELEFGTALVSIPKGHREGELESPVWWKLEFREDPSKHIVLQELNPMPAREMFSALRRSLESAGEKALLVFVHGYNHSFERGARRTAQIAYDLRFQGIPILYSWPANGKALDYFADETDGRWTVPHLVRFLEDLAEASRSAKIHLIAHSMGAQPLTDALRRIAQDHAEPLFDQVILAAPDVDADVFADDLLPAVRSTSRRVTLYASSDDRALQVSRKLHQYQRAGESGEHLIVAQGLDTIDASTIDTGWLGHSYFAETKRLLDDLYELVQRGLPPGSRGLLERQKERLRYWLLQHLAGEE